MMSHSCHRGQPAAGCCREGMPTISHVLSAHFWGLKKTIEKKALKKVQAKDVNQSINLLHFGDIYKESEVADQFITSALDTPLLKPDFRNKKAKLNTQFKCCEHQTS